MFLSALGTSRAEAGGLAAQRKLDYDLNMELARAAKEAGTSVYAIISSAGVNKDSRMPYMKLKGEIEESAREIGFDHTVIVKPGLLMGDRERSRALEAPVRAVASLMKKAGPSFIDWWAQDAEVVARATVHASLLCAEGKREKGVWLLSQADIVRLGRTEWPAIRS